MVGRAAMGRRALLDGARRGRAAIVGDPLRELGLDRAVRDAALRAGKRRLEAGRLSARARVKNAGRSLGLIECDVLDSGDKLVAHAVSTCMILRPAESPARAKAEHADGRLG